MRFYSVIFSLLAIINMAVAQDEADQSSIGQDLTYNPIRTTVPFLTIAPDSRSGAMGDAGVATSPDVASQHWNSAKYPFMKERFGFGISYSPWLSKIINDISLSYVSGYYKFDERQTASASIRYFSLGNIPLTNESGVSMGDAMPNEWAIDLGYSRMFSEHFSMGLAFRAIQSDIAGGAGAINTASNDYNKGFSVAADINGYYQNSTELYGKETEYAFGYNLSNIGTKMSYSGGANKEFIPTNLRLGGRISMEIDEFNSIGLTIDANKLMVPTTPKTENDSIIAGKDQDVGSIQGIVQSFYDAPRGFKEEMEEFILSVGAEYWYANQFAVRAGYFHEALYKGNRKYFTAGVGIKLNVFSIDFSYLIPRGNLQSHPLANTMRFTIKFVFE